MKKLPLSGILIFSIAALVLALVLGLSASGAMPLTGFNSGQTSFSGQIGSVALNPQPEPPAPYSIGANAGKGLFSGLIMTVSLNPQPEPPMPFNIGKTSLSGMQNAIFSGQIQTVMMNPQPKTERH